MRIGILTAIWQRHDLSRIVLEYYRDLEIDGVEFVRVAVGSEGKESKDLAESCGWEYVKAKNNPLSDKWNRGCESLKDRVDAVLIVGSDDLLNKEYFEEAIVMLSTGSDCVSLEDMYTYSALDGSCHFIPRSYPGAGTIVKANQLDKVDWNPWPEGVNRRLDGAMLNRMYELAAPFPQRRIKTGAKSVLVDIKSTVNMWSVQEIIEMVGRGHSVDGSDLLDKQFPDIREKINQLPCEE